MLQIKTIFKGNTQQFDEAVNLALQEGWTLNRRCLVPEGFVAEMEKTIVTDNEKCCENCKHVNESPEREPCLSCSETCSEWEAQE